MNRPTESDYVSHVAYTRALEEYCNKVEPTSADYAMGFAEGFNEGCRPRPWQGLTDTEIDYQAKKDDHGVYFALGALWAEAKLKERNT
jgi:hypothetical protein